MRRDRNQLLEADAQSRQLPMQSSSLASKALPFLAPQDVRKQPHVPSTSLRVTVLI
jgi:hypothetical protein